MEIQALAFNKTIAHNMSAVVVLKPTYGILDWTIQEVRNIDIKHDWQLSSDKK